jgi:Helix-turn-helix domain
MTARKHDLSKAEIRRAFADGSGASWPPILSPSRLAQLLGRSPRTVYEWIRRGHFDGCFRKRGKHDFIWRDRAIEILFNGPDWKTHNEQT